MINKSMKQNAYVEEGKQQARSRKHVGTEFEKKTRSRVVGKQRFKRKIQAFNSVLCYGSKKDCVGQSSEDLSYALTVAQSLQISLVFFTALHWSLLHNED